MGGGVSESSNNLTEALHQGAWLPCRVIDVNPTRGIILVQVNDRGGPIEVWLRTDQVRQR